MVILKQKNCSDNVVWKALKQSALWEKEQMMSTKSGYCHGYHHSRVSTGDVWLALDEDLRCQ